MSAAPSERSESQAASWRAPGVDAHSSPLVTVLLARLDEVLDELHEMSLGGLSDADVVLILDATTSASARLTSTQCRAAAEADRRRLGDSVGARHTTSGGRGAAA